MENKPELIGTKEAGAILNLSVYRVGQFIREGRLNADKISERWVLRRDEVEEFARLPRHSGRPLDSDVNF